MKTFGTILLIVGGLIVGVGVWAGYYAGNHSYFMISDDNRSMENWTQLFIGFRNQSLLILIAGLLVCILGALLRIHSAQRPSITSTS